MLSSRFIEFIFSKHIKSGLYIDYYLRLIGKKFIRNGLIWGSLYVSEKFIIEYLTRFVTNVSKRSVVSSTSPILILKSTILWIFVISVLVYI